MKTDVRDWLCSKHINPDLALVAGVKFDPKKRVIMFPRLSLDKGNLVGYKCRNIDSDYCFAHPAGISHKDTRPFTTRKGTGCLIICEGETDALALASNLFLLDQEDPHIIAIPGATTFCNEWVGLYKDFDDVYLVPDPDEAGSKLVNKVCGLMGRTKVVRLREEWGDLSEHIENQAGSLHERFNRAAPVASTHKLRRVGYDFQRTHDLSNHLLTEEVLKYTDLRRRGGNDEYTGLCPLHEEKTPSFMVNPEKGQFYCFGCKEGGDIVRFIQKKEDISYGEALRKARALGGHVR